MQRYQHFLAYTIEIVCVGHFLIMFHIIPTIITDFKSMEQLKAEEVIGRLEDVIQAFRLSRNAFCKEIMIDPSNLSRKLNGQSPITTIDANKINQSLGISAEWLLNGKGDMLTDKGVEEYLNHLNSFERGAIDRVLERRSEREIPCYDIDFSCSVVESYDDNLEKPSSYISVPGTDKADFCCRAFGDSMMPIIMSGDIIAMKRVEDWATFLPLNEIYGVVAANGLRAIKVIRASKNDTKFMLHSYNEVYEDQEIDKSSILAIYKVVACIKRF